ncbi:MAG: hypothetical protein ABR585_07820 [Gemmatimonadaceae bacterium]
MTFSQDAWFNDSYVKTMRQTITIDVGSTTPGLFKGALWQGSITPDFSQTNPAYNASPWDSGQTSGPGYTAGGQDLTVVSFAELSTANKVGWKFSPVVWTATTLAAEGLLIYAPSLSNRAFLFRWLTQEYTTSDGDLTATFHTDGAWRTVLRTTA